MDNYVQNFIHIPKFQFWGVQRRLRVGIFLPLACDSRGLCVQGQMIKKKTSNMFNFVPRIMPHHVAVFLVQNHLHTISNQHLWNLLIIDLCQHLFHNMFGFCVGFDGQNSILITIASKVFTQIFGLVCWFGPYVLLTGRPQFIQYVIRTNPLRPRLDHVDPYKLTNEHQYISNTYTNFIRSNAQT